ncbi:hypothetical protein [Prauserella cavernicola]|uniref:Uncharacterized protein n=1 Tax=Prauserella cavernicola TaxID=2800127 RepID=A0A934QR14_9PSEU|nr:hypothetical protein [Prauserella cavernicola]MBK1785136.1 hypothetical protein [Prauserella cavernicola]
MKLKITLTPEHGDAIDIETNSRDVLNWERTTKGASFGSFVDDMHIVDLYKIAWYASRRLGEYSGPLKEFEQAFDLEVDRASDDEDDDELDPTQLGL